MTPQLAVFLPGLYGGGAERTMLNLADGFAQYGVAVDLVVGVAEGMLLDQIPASVRYFPLGVDRTRYVLPALIRYMRQESPATLLTALNRANLMAIGARSLSGMKSRLVISERNRIIHAQQTTSIVERLYPLLGRIFYPWADEIVGVSHSVADELSQVMHLDPERITVIENPVVTPDLRQKAEESVDHPWLTINEPPVIISVGRLSEQKDLSTLIHAFAQLRLRRNARLIILGEGPQRRHLETLIDELGLTDDILLPGWVPNPIAYVRQAAVFVLCSRWEGLPGALIEALYCGTPVIATDSPGGTREVLKDGKYGALIPVGDVGRLADLMVEMLSAPLQSPPAESWQRYELTRVLARYAKVLRIDLS